jgi:hypothetical protein
MKAISWAALALSGGLLLALLAIRPAQGQQVLQYGFEGREPVWVQSQADAPYKELLHRITDETAHLGQRCEHIQLQVESGSYIHYTYDVGRAPVTEDLNVSLWVKANRPGVRLMCRVVLPHERDPRNADQPLTTLISGDTAKLTSRWQPLAVSQPVKRLREQEQLLCAELKRPVVTADAYVDRIVLNLYAGPGLTDVWTDDLEVGPVFDTHSPSTAPSGSRSVPSRPAVNRRATEVQLKGNQLLVSGQRVFMRMIRYGGTPLRTLRNAGFNTVGIDETAPVNLLEDAVAQGFYLMPTVRGPWTTNPPGGTVEGTLTSQGELAATEAFTRTVGRFLEQDAVLAWGLGSNLAFDDYPGVARTAQAIRSTDPMRPVAADVWDGFQRYSRSLDQLLLGIHRWPLMTTLELTAYRDWLTQRRRLAAPDTFTWTWVQTHLPDWFLTQAYPAARVPSGEPLGPQAEQIRLLAYTAIGAGCRGLGFWSDRFLADSTTGRDRLLALAQLNQELFMLEPLLVAAKEPDWIDTSRPEVKAAVLRTDKAVLVLPIWMGPGSQFVPGQGATADLMMTVPQIPDNFQAWEVSPGRVQGLRTERPLGGTRVHLHNFSLTAAIVFTADLGPTGLVVRFQNLQHDLGKVATQWAHDQAQEEFTKAVQVHTTLEQMGHTLPDGTALVDKARTALDRCLEHRRNNQHTEAYDDAQVALRCLRTLMRAHWDKAVREMSTPVASVDATSYYTLPRHWQFWDRVKGLHPAANVLPDGDFESPPDQVPPGWLVQEVPSLDEVKTMARRVTTKPKQGKQCLMLRVSPKDDALAPLALERTFLAIHSPAVQLRPGTLVRISGWVQIPGPIQASADGVLFYDSAGGEPLAARLTGSTPWKQLMLYREVPPSGTLNVTMALTGLGTVYFDDIRIEPLR